MSKAKVQTLDNLIENLQMFRRLYGNLPLLYSIDDEGSEFKEVIIVPTPMSINKDLNNFDSTLDNPTHLCIN